MKQLLTSVIIGSCIVGLFLCVTSHKASAVKNRTTFEDCKVISDVGYNTVYSCPEGVIYVVKKK